MNNKKIPDQATVNDANKEKNKKRGVLLIVVSILIVLIIISLFSYDAIYLANRFVEPRTQAVETTQVESLQGIKEVNLVEDLGATPNDNQDDSKAFQEALNLAKEEPIKLVIPAGEYLSTGPSNVEATEIKGLHIQGDNAVIKPENPMINPPEYYFMKLYLAEDNVGVEIEGITIDGSLNPQDLYFTLEEPEDIYDLQLQRGIQIDGAHEVYVHDVTFQHMYGGYALSIYNYSQVDIQNVTIDDVGGDDITDSFGMALNFGGHSGDAVINIDNVQAQGKVSDRDPSYTAWIGVVLQNGSIQSADYDQHDLDQNTTVNITNSSFMDYETTFHVESMAGNVYWNSDNITTRAKDYFIAAGINGEIKERTNNLTMEMTPWGRNGIVHGLYYTEKEKEKNLNRTHEFSMYNSTIDYLTLDGVDPITVGASYGDSVIGNYYNVTFNNLPHYLVVNGSANLVDSQINLAASNPFDSDTLAQGPFNDERQFVRYQGSTAVNPAGQHQSAETTDIPDWYVNYGNVPEPLTEPIGPAELSGE
ncbi:glycoside hydrolase family protein [Fundicoccus culcitae]|uniref:Pectate lyase superfamily protein domain-containing protein n=1 Tax=Fundicoccus culcitae TaxID=2969821 RepID=A0ABY5P928_9LACT|nr:hypothetical protein [Fundicoccus culcitae]UUX35261.1 hypothetical protein NRE15_06350 [Fundicoccus culcitae]